MIIIGSQNELNVGDGGRVQSGAALGSDDHLGHDFIVVREATFEEWRANAEYAAVRAFLDTGYPPSRMHWYEVETREPQRFIGMDWKNDAIPEQAVADRDDPRAHGSFSSGDSQSYREDSWQI